ncbi:hypothetical protein QQF64_024309 [Cirrhinus molitorella]|uniref:Uncharacterized protein n=1 Tax=Cirrhinus molitorella TaxID=172907 RepID=A0ABR3NLH9_9TELE
MKSSFAEHKPYISSVGALVPYSPRTSSTGFEGSCDVWHHRCSPVTIPRRLSGDSLQRLSKSSAFHGAREKYKLIKAVAILDGWFFLSARLYSSNPSSICCFSRRTSESTFSFHLS